MFMRLIQRRRGDTNEVAHDLALATQATIRRLSFQPKFLTTRHGGEILGALDDLHHTRATQAVALTVELFINSLVNGNIMKQRRFAEVCVLSTIHLFARIQKLNRRHNSPL